MKIIEALKELPLITKKIEDNQVLIRKHSSVVVIGDQATFAYGSEEAQRKEVASLVQSTHDLVTRQARLRRVLALTNATVKVTVDGVTKSITEWIDYRQKGLETLRETYRCLNTDTGLQALRTVKAEPTQGVRVLQMYDEKEKNTTAQELMGFETAIDTALEITNATTDLVEAI